LSALGRKISEKIWGGRTPSEVLSKRFRIFVLIAIVLAGISKLLYLHRILPANVELIIPTLVVVGSLSLYCGPTKFWRRATRYFGLLVLVAVAITDLAFWGPSPIFVFTWSGFILCWLLAMRHKLSMFDKFKSLLWRTTLTAAAAIIIFDLYTGVLGWSLVTGTGLVTVFLSQIPFTIYHLCSLLFVPPLVGLAKAMVKVKVPVPVAIAVKSGVEVQAS
jgi:hypothetical protein